MPELLLELGTEELPATFVEKALNDLKALVTEGLREHGLLGGEAAGYATPRRLILGFPDVAARQEDRTKESRGPAIASAFDADGNPSKAVQGFCRGQGIDPSQLEQRDGYVWANVHVPGKPAAEILATLLPDAIRKLTFEKSMRWGSSRLRFARPIRWILAAFDCAAVPFEIEGVASGTESRGHRFYAPGAFSATTLDELLGKLRAAKVEPDPTVRRQAILDQARAVASGEPDLPESLVQENTYLTEWPTAIAGRFKEEFMELPEPVLVTAMAKHERMFPVRGADGRLLREFVFIRNSGEDDSVRQGTEWVLNARFNDAKFFLDEDRKRTFDEFLEKSSTIVFQEKLGTVRARADRLASLAEQVALATGADAREAELASKAALYAKADLSTGLVSELSSLQGVVGGDYAAREGFEPEVCAALAGQYDPAKSLGPTDASARTTQRLIIADQLDKLAGFLGIGLEPTGSSDPYGLRRAATVLIEVAWAWPGTMPGYEDLFAAALEGVAQQGIAVDRVAAHAALHSLFAARYSTLMPDTRFDVLEAALIEGAGPEATRPQSVRFRVEVMESLKHQKPLIQTLTRPLNIVTSAKRKGIEYAWEDPLAQVDPSQLDSAEAEELLRVLKRQEEPVFRAAAERSVEGILRSLEALGQPINRFFDSTMVMAEDEAVRYARLSLMHAASLQVLFAGDVSKLAE